jgi:hypothetical protein
LADEGLVAVRRWGFYFLALSALGFVVGYFTYDENRRLAGAPTAPAVVTDVVRFSKGGPYVAVEIMLPDGRTVRTTTESFYDSPRPLKGNRIVVQYAIDGRDVWAREAGIGPDRAGQWGWTSVGGVSGVVGGVLVFRGRRRAVGDEEGDAVEDPG